MEEQSRIIKDQSNLGQFGSAIAQICEEKSIDKERVIISIEAALAAAYKKDYGKKGQIIIANLDEKTSETKFRQFKEVVDETTRTIEEEYIPEEVHQVPEHAIKSEEKIERHQVDHSRSEDKEEEISLPKFNSERDVLLSDAKEVIKDIELGDYIEYTLQPQDQYGRIASQTAKQVIIQKIREAERESMYEEFKNREGEIVNGTVQRVEGGRVFVDLGKSVGILFPSEQIPGEEYRMGQRLKLYIDRVDADSRSLGINLSRKHPQLLAKLFELEVPEIFAGTIEIKAVAREAGNRSKIAVVSNEEGIDPIGSCVGQKGTRVQSIIDELNGEKIDIIEWVNNVEEMIAQSLSPAKVVKVELTECVEAVDEKDSSVDSDEAEDSKDDSSKDDTKEDSAKDDVKEDSAKSTACKRAVAYVMDDQLSLAIGRRGQNVRLAAKLTGWNINVEALNAEDNATDEEPEQELSEAPGEETKDVDKKDTKKIKEAKEGSEKKTKKTKETKEAKEPKEPKEPKKSKKSKEDAVKKSKKEDKEKEVEGGEVDKKSTTKKVKKSTKDDKKESKKKSSDVEDKK